MHTLVVPSILGLFWEETLSNFGGARYRSGSLRAKWSPGEPCGDKGIGSYVVDSGQAKARKKWWRCEGGGRSRTPEVQYCWSQSTHVVSFYERQKRRFAWKGGRMPTCESRSGNANPNPSRDITSTNGLLPRRDKCRSNWRYTYSTVDIRLRNRVLRVAMTATR